MSRVPDWKLERYALGELPAEEMAAVGRALLDEPGGADRLAALRASDERFLRVYPPLLAVPALRAAQPPPRSFWAPWLLGPALALGAAALLLGPRLLAEVAPPAAPPVEEGVQIKGPSAGLEVHRQRGDEIERLAEGAEAAPGDVVQLSMRAEGHTFGLVLSIDGRGGLTRHLPRGGAEAAPLPAGHTALPSSFELDDAPAFERFFLVTAPEPFAVEPVLEAARALARRPDAETAPLRLPPPLRATPFLLHKVRR